MTLIEARGKVRQRLPTALIIRSPRLCIIGGIELEGKERDSVGSETHSVSET